MKCLSVKQPFAGLIAAGTKRLEIRTWQTNYRGPLLICAGLTAHRLYVQYDARIQMVELCNLRSRVWHKLPFDLFKIDGCAVCVVDLVGVRPFLKGSMSETDACVDHIEGAFAWEMENPRLIKSFPIKGQLRLWDYNGPEIEYV